MAGRAEGELIAGFDVRRAFGASVVLSGVDIMIRRGEVVALLGGSGSGKSTLLRALAGLDPDATGTITRHGRSAVVFQEHRLLPWKRVAANVGLGLTGDVPRRVAAALAEVGLADRERAWPAELSGGQAQRVAFARALVREPDLLLLDEPFGALDALTRLRMQGLFGRLRAEHGFSALFVTHDVDEALLLSDRILLLDGGVIAEDIAVDLDHPRTPDHSGFGVLRRRLLARLGVPVLEEIAP
ncbi:aliphatic sulfonates import ATP-binding protein SsuB [Asanoa ishikariensis]|uniref:Sulfonate transport system ATP-binding protein n=1 Tax=Asanoa ishikariensis TaxID=137265 RepID=A0A1H3UJ78_9ACTN|nr:ABC transporter ATP-binding protein [Asanoa ishikariensis]GIF63354.1 aliphatic sulfonates import ATP-binding protein SsuB [Asanoa ishikariensis]SDZ62513.1 sulfonate transport system ATP-binding protein [Asanoa ishikariensis]